MKIVCYQRFAQRNALQIKSSCSGSFCSNRHGTRHMPARVPVRSGWCPALHPAWAGWHAGSLGLLPGIAASLGRLACRLARRGTRHHGRPVPAPMPVGSGSQPARDPACAGSFAGSPRLYILPFFLGGTARTVFPSPSRPCLRCSSLKVLMLLHLSPIHLAILPTSNPQI